MSTTISRNEQVINRIREVTWCGFLSALDLPRGYDQLLEIDVVAFSTQKDKYEWC